MIAEDRDNAGTDRCTTIIVNGREKEFCGAEISYEQVIRFAYDNPPFGDNTIYSVTYKRGHADRPAGTLVAGQSVKVKKGMVFNVTATDKS